MVVNPDGSESPICDFRSIDERNYLWLCFSDAPHTVVAPSGQVNQCCTMHLKYYQQAGWSLIQSDFTSSKKEV